MLTYLQDGWYEDGPKKRLKDEVVDGAIDSASMLLMENVPAEIIMKIALKLRMLSTVRDPMMKKNKNFGAKERHEIAYKLEKYTEDHRALHSFILDCLDHVNTSSELLALYLHLVHVMRMVQLLKHSTEVKEEPQVGS